jgi:hypothetical protein
MSIKDIEYYFNRAFLQSFSKKKFFCVFLLLSLCGIISLFCKVVSYKLGFFALSFLPVFLSLGFLLPLGTLLVRVYYNEIKGTDLTYRKLLCNSWDLVMASSYLSIAVISLYLVFLVLLAVFVLIQELPVIGEVIGAVFSFIPFLMVLLSVFLILLVFLVLFFVIPAISFATNKKLHVLKTSFLRIKESLFSNIITFIIGLLPMALVSFFLLVSMYASGFSNVISENILSLFIKWFFVMITCCFFLTPTVIFFFNFAAESYNFFNKKES